MSTRSLYFLFTLILPFIGFSQSSFIHYTIENGLPSNEVYEVFQDSKGYIWFATDHGVVKYNSTYFKVYTTEHGLPDNTIFRFYEDYKGRIWFFSFKGNIGYYYLNQFYSVKLSGELNPKFIIGLAVDTTDHIEILFKDDDYSIEFDLNEESIITESNLNSKEVQINGDVKISSIGQHNSTIANSISNVIKNGKFIYGHALKNTYNQISINERNSEIVFKKKDGSIIQTIEQAPNTYSTGSGIINNQFYSCLNNNKIYFYNADGITIDSLNLGKNIPTSIIKDNQNGTWISTLNNGVIYEPNSHISKKMFPDSLSKKGIGFYGTDESNTLISTSDNKVFTITKKGINPIYKFIRNINQIKLIQNHLYMSSEHEVVVFDNGKAMQKNYVINPKDEPGFNDFTVDSEGDFIHCSFNHFSLSGQKFTIENAERLSVLINTKDTLWLGGMNGLFEVPKHHLTGNKLNISPILNDRVTCMKKRNNCLYIGTRGNGIIMFKGAKIYRVRTNDGLVNNSISDIDIDLNGQIWVASNSGLSKINIQSYHPFTPKIINYGREDGILETKVSDLQIFGDSIHFTTNNALYKISSRYKRQPVKPILNLKKYSINNEDYQLYTKPLQIDYENRNILFLFDMINYRNNEKSILEYNLNSDHWTKTSSNQINLNNLAPGKYQLAVRTQSGIEKSNTVYFNFEIHPPFWLRWWFICLEILVSILIVYSIIKYIIKQNQTKSKLIETELKALRAQMNPHFTFNSMNSIQSFVLENKKSEALDFISNYSNLVRLILNNSRMEHIPLKDEIALLKLYMEVEKVRLNNRFDFSIIIDESIDTQYEKIPSMVLQPFIENAIWHGVHHKKGKGHISLVINDVHPFMEIIIEDNGVGREKSNELKLKDPQKINYSLGTAIAKERLSLINKSEKINFEILDLKDDDGKPLGTKVILKILKI